MTKAKKRVHKKTVITETIVEKPKKKTSKRKTKKVSRKKTVTKKHPSDDRIEKALIENFIGLQKAITNMAVRFDGLSDQMSKLLNLFEVSAKSLAEKDFEAEHDKTKEDLSKKLDGILEQNRVIAKGITMIHEEDENDRRIEKGMSPIPGTKMPPYKNVENLNPPQPNLPQNNQMPGTQGRIMNGNQGSNEYQKSIGKSVV